MHNGAQSEMAVKKKNSHFLARLSTLKKSLLKVLIDSEKNLCFSSFDNCSSPAVLLLVSLMPNLSRNKIQNMTKRKEMLITHRPEAALLLKDSVFLISFTPIMPVLRQKRSLVQGMPHTRQQCRINEGAKNLPVEDILSTSTRFNKI